MQTYWDKVLNRRLSRRRALAATGATAAAAAFLAACGGDDGDGGDGGGGGGGGGIGSDQLINGKEVDSTAQAKRGGTFKAALQRDPQNFDLYNFDPFSQGFNNLVGSKLVYLRPSRMKDPGALDVASDLATWEISPDKLTYTFKLSPNAKFGPLSSSFHSGAPQSIANRPYDSDDVMYSWERFGTVSSNAGELIGSKGGPVDNISAPDKSTVVMKLKQPFSPLLATLANGSVSYFYVLPKEGKAGDANFFNKWAFGGGPFYIDNFEPSVRLILKRNPNYEQRDVQDGGLKRPFIDEVNFTMIPDPTQATAQFKVGQLYQPGLGLTVDDNIQLKKDVPKLQMRALLQSTAVVEWFGMSKDGPWKDQRVRQAVQYSWDRDTFIDVFFATDKLEAAGIPDQRRWNTSIPCGGPGDYMYFPGMWLDPQGKDFGENAKYFTLGDHTKNITEAKRLLSAAGFANGIDFTHIQYPLGFGQQPAQDIIEGMMQEIGLKATQKKETIPDIFGRIFHEPGKPGGDWKEMFNTVDFGGPDVGNFLKAHFHKGGNLFGGWNPNDQGASIDGDPFLNDTTDKVLLEFDNAKRVQLVQDFQRYMAKMFYISRYPGGATALQLVWPAVANWNVFRGYGLDGIFTYEWLDQTKAPFVS